MLIIVSETSWAQSSTKSGHQVGSSWVIERDFAKGNFIYIISLYIQIMHSISFWRRTLAPGSISEDSLLNVSDDEPPTDASTPFRVRTFCGTFSVVRVVLFLSRQDLVHCLRYRKMDQFSTLSRLKCLQRRWKPSPSLTRAFRWFN